MSGIQCDFIHDQGDYMILSEDGGMLRNRLADHEIAMLEHHDIPGQLSLALEESEGVVRLRYNITGKRMLRHQIGQSRLEADHYCKLLAHVAELLANCKTYLLHERNVLLGDQFIFTGQDISDVYLTYVPFKRRDDEASLQESFRYFALNLLSRVGNVENIRVQQLVELLSGEGRWLSEPQKLSGLFRAVKDNEHFGESADAPVQHEAECPPIDPGETQWENKAGKAGKTRKPIGKIRERLRMGLKGAALLFAMRKKPDTPDDLFQSDDGDAFAELSGLDMGSRLEMNEMQWADEESIPASNDYYERLPERTQFLRKPEATTVLSDDSNVKNVQRNCRIIVTKGEERTIHDVEGERFVIGRSGEQADFVDDTPGVSRVHCEILRKDGSLSVRDLGSVNGSQFNGERMAPYRTYTFNPGDKLRIIQTEISLME